MGIGDHASLVQVFQTLIASLGSVFLFRLAHRLTSSTAPARSMRVLNPRDRTRRKAAIAFAIGVFVVVSPLVLAINRSTGCGCRREAA
jgi:hypothetical protein